MEERVRRTLVLVRCRATVLRWDGPAPTRTRGASAGQPEGCSYASWREDRSQHASWRELCGVELSAHESPRGGWGERGIGTGERVNRLSTYHFMKKTLQNDKYVL